MKSNENIVFGLYCILISIMNCGGLKGTVGDANDLSVIIYSHSLMKTCMTFIKKDISQELYKY